MTDRTRSAAAWLLAVTLGLGLAACKEPLPTLVLVSVDARPSVLDSAELRVTVYNEDASVSDSFDLHDHAYPVTFTVTPKNRTGEIRIEVVALDDNGLPRGQGSATGTLVPDDQIELEIRLDPDDFVVNSSIAGTQKLTFDWEAPGRQLATAADDSFVITFVNDCSTLSRCDVFARRFSPNSAPAVNDITQDTGEFIVNLADEFASVPAIAIGDGAMMATWYTEDAVRGAALTATAGHASASETVISTTTTEWPTDAAVAVLASGDFVVVWSETVATGGSAIRGRLLGPDGTPRANPVTSDTLDFPISVTADRSYAVPSVTSTGDGHGFVVVWRDYDNLYARDFDRTAAPVNATEVALTSYPVSATVFGPHAGWFAGSLVVVWGVSDYDDAELADGAYLLRRFEAPSLQPLTSIRMLTHSTADTYSPPALAIGGGGIGTVWHLCGVDGDSSGCGIFFQQIRPSGLAVGDPMVVNTTLHGDQTGPSIAARSDGFVVAWSDESEQPPDTVEGAVRARLIFPDTDPNDGRRGARCGQPEDQPCDDGLVCMPGNTGRPYCHEQCDPSGPDPRCPNGGVCTTLGDASGCVF